MAMRRVLLVLLGVVLTMGTLTAPASAVPRQEVYWRPIPYNGQKYQTVRLDCPAGMKATGGGVIGDGVPHISGSRSVGNGAGWELIVWQENPRDLNVTIACWSGLTQFTSLTTWTDVAPGAIGSASNLCPARSRTFLGGGAYASDPSMPLKNFASYYDYGWQASYRNTTAVQQRVYVQVICAEGLTARRWETTRGEHMTDSFISATLYCPAGTDVVSGGALGPNVEGQWVLSPTETITGWEVASEREGDDTFFQARVLCAY
ncbi:hypothetical protein GCM10009745_77750 [Kribbella yunnanensis]|uniref:Uncharacterized protein n=1 Tax=Kribbella yunnanensis TaxID=190194 RepID=A0ABP4V3Z9_9ACTN